MAVRLPRPIRADVPPLSRRLRSAREALGLPQTLVATAAHVDPSHLARIERGHTAPTVATLFRIAQVLDLDDLVDALRPYLDDEPDT